MTFDRLFISFLVREEFNLTKFEEILEQQRRHCVDKGLNLPFHGRTEMDTADVKILKIKERRKSIRFIFQDEEDADDAEEESEGGEPEDEMDAQQGSGSPGTTIGIPPTVHDT